MSTKPELVCACWTSAGNVAPRWPSELSPFRIEDRIDAIARSGWRGMGISQDDLSAVRDSMGFGELRSRIADAGLEHTQVEVLTDWWLTGPAAQASRDTEELLCAAAEELGATHIKVVTAFSDGPSPVEPLAEPLAALVDRAAGRGLRIALEPLPFSMVASVPAGADLVRMVGNPACGLVVDAWAVFRADTDLATLGACLEPDRVFAVELDDAPRTVRGSLFEDTIDNRKLCGEGDFDLTQFVKTMTAVGFDGPWSVEIISAQHRMRDLDDAVGSACRTGLRTVLDALSA